MPYVMVKMYPGRTEDQKMRLAEQIALDVVNIAKCPMDAVTVSIDEVDQDDWEQEVAKPFILNNEASLYIKTGKSLTK